jgi:ribose/xylose/arabinose/galactoside ABC-type transport system permease subunit
MKEVTMAAIAHALSRAFQSAGEFDALKQIALLCGAGLLVTLLCLTYGLDLSPGFF